MIEYFFSILDGINITLWGATTVAFIVAMMSAIAAAETRDADAKRAHAARVFRCLLVAAVVGAVNALVPTANELVEAHEARCKMTGECAK